MFRFKSVKRNDSPKYIVCKDKNNTIKIKCLKGGDLL